MLGLAVAELMRRRRRAARRRAREVRQQRRDEVGARVSRLRDRDRGCASPSPTPSFRTTSAAAATTETSAERRCGVMAGSGLEIAAERLLALDRLEERLEVAVAEAARAVPLDHLEEERRPVLRGLREDLQQVAVVVAVGEDAQPAQVVPALVDLADAVGRLLVVRVGRRQEDDAALAAAPRRSRRCATTAARCAARRGRG